MGQQFGVQIAEIDKQQQEWVPRQNDPYGGAQGMRLIGHPFGVDQLWTALAITDTAAHASAPAQDQATSNPTGAPYDAQYAVYKTVLITSTLNEAVSIQLTASVDGLTYYPLGDPVTVPAWAGGSAPAASAWITAATPSQYVPFVGAVATCATAPTSGVLNGQVARLG